jgi:hypothetical protein
MKHASSLVLISITLIVLYFIVTKTEISYVKSDDGQQFQVVNLPNKDVASNLLSQIQNRINKLTDHLWNNISKYPDYKDNITMLYNRTRNLVLSENEPNNSYTTYTVNKGEKIVFCLRSKDTYQFHDINLLMFVTIHELSHVACPEIDHTPLFVSIFIFLLNIGMELNLYIYENYQQNPVMYCGMKLNETPLNNSQIKKNVK